MIARSSQPSTGVVSWSALSDRNLSFCGEPEVHPERQIHKDERVRQFHAFFNRWPRSPPIDDPTIPCHDFTNSLNDKSLGRTFPARSPLNLIDRAPHQVVTFSEGPSESRFAPTAVPDHNCPGHLAIVSVTVGMVRRSLRSVVPTRPVEDHRQPTVGQRLRVWGTPIAMLPVCHHDAKFSRAIFEQMLLSIARTTIEHGDVRWDTADNLSHPSIVSEDRVAGNRMRLPPSSRRQRADSNPLGVRPCDPCRGRSRTVSLPGPRISRWRAGRVSRGHFRLLFCTDPDELVLSRVTHHCSVRCSH